MIALRLILGCVFGGFLFIGFNAFAQKPPEPPEEFRRFASGKQYRDQLNAALTEQEASLLLPTCTNFTIGKSLGIYFIKLPVFDDGAATPKDGQWIERVSINRCGTESIRNFLVNVDKSIQITALVPGRTRTTPPYQIEALNKAKPITMEKLGCKGLVQPVDTAYVDLKSNIGMWRENWTWVGCEKTIEVPIYFVPHSGKIEIIIKFDGP